MAYGTESIPKVQKICGPGNAYVTGAKEIVARQGTAIDLPAGPSEVLVIADSSAQPAYVAADLLAQAEHGPDSQVVLLTTDQALFEAVQRELLVQLEQLPRKEIAEKALENSVLCLLPSLERALELSNYYAPEHLIIASSRAQELAEQVTCAGSVFLGNNTPEAAGDYASGTNHTLPTAGWARSVSGVSVDTFVKKVTFQEISASGLAQIGATVMTMAQHEGLEAHSRAVSLRLEFGKPRVTENQ
jgi:histidinol dehydrogenase